MSTPPLPSPRLPRDRYLDLPEIDLWGAALVEAHPALLRRDQIGHSGEGRPIWLYTLGRIDGAEDHRPAFWVDGGTHCAEWAGVSAAVDGLQRWLDEAVAGGPLADWLGQHTLYVAPCVSPDGYAAMRAGAPYTRSTTEQAPEGTVEAGWTPRDLTGDGVVRLLRWRHPAGPFVVDAEAPLHMRARRLDDDAADAFFVAEEGQFELWDGARWTAAPRKHGLDLNRNFPGDWAPRSGFGMNGGAFPGSAPEARAMLDALHARPNVAAAITHHTFSGVLLIQPYRADSVLGESDLLRVKALAQDAVRGTRYAAVPVHPDFAYDPKAAIGGVWADTLATVFGLPAYTLEIWDPFAAAGVTPAHRGRFFREPEPAVLQALVRRFADAPGSAPWTAFDHPQLGPVELGGLDLQRTVRNPPEAMLAEELDQVFTIVDRARRALPRLEVQLRVVPLGPDHAEINVQIDNLGFLPTAGLERGAAVGRAPALRLEIDGHPPVALGQLEGWGCARVGAASMPLLPALSQGGSRLLHKAVVTGPGPWRVAWHSARAGRGEAWARREG